MGKSHQDAGGKKNLVKNLPFRFEDFLICSLQCTTYVLVKRRAIVEVIVDQIVRLHGRLADLLTGFGIQHKYSVRPEQRNFSS